MRIAVVGGGIAGLGAAWSLSRHNDVVVYENERRLGGHACTIAVPLGDVPLGGVPLSGVPGVGGTLPVDTGFIVFNERNYPNLVALFGHLGVATQESDMSFAVSLDGGRFEYASSLGGYVAQRRNLLSPSFLRMTRDILRFNRLAPRLLAQSENLDMSLARFIADAGLGEEFRDRYLVPMASCIWSTPLARMLDYPAQTFARFFDNHGLLTVGRQLRWRTVSGGSRSYVERIAAPLQGRARLATPVRTIRRDERGVRVQDASGHWDRFDKLVVACHADQALALLGDASPGERELLGCFRYSSNEVWLHADAKLMPRRRRIWSSWNYIAPSRAACATAKASVTYWMNRLQSLPHPRPILVSVNPVRDPAEETVWQRFTFGHPTFDSDAIRAQRRLHEIQGARHTYFCGSYCGYGFHEDALASGLEVAEALGAPRPWRRPHGQRRAGDPVRPTGGQPLLSPMPLPIAARVAP